jgi:hypothetical protein
MSGVSMKAMPRMLGTPELADRRHIARFLAAAKRKIALD